MRILLINETMRKQSTYNIGRIFIDMLKENDDDVKEIFLPEAMPEFCVGCSNCFMISEEKCPHYKYASAVEEAMNEADLLVFTSPVYVYHTTGQLKTMLDHFGYRWMVHRPNGKMFKKQALVISTAAGGGMKSTNTDIADSLTFWGVGRIYKYGIGVGAIKWSEVKDKKRAKIQKDMKRIALKIKSRYGRVKPSLKVKIYFYIMRILQKKGGFNKADNEYWKSNGWLDGKKLSDIY